MSELREELRNRALSDKGNIITLIKRFREAASAEEQEGKVAGENVASQDILGPTY